MSKQRSTSNREGPAKAGKRQVYQRPPEPNPAKAAARAKGRQQFYTNDIAKSAIRLDESRGQVVWHTSRREVHG